MNDQIIIRGATQNNLRNIDVEIPRNQVVVFTGVSGSGKSSLVFDTICAEAQRQLIETFSTYARRRLPKISKPGVEEIENISPAIVIDQKRLGTTLRSTVGTVTEIYNYLRMLYSRCGEPFIGWSNAFSFNLPDGMCQSCKGLGKEMDIDIPKVLDPEKSIAEGAILHSDFKKGGWYWKGLMKCGFYDPHKPVREFTELEMYELLHKEATTFINVHQGEEYNATYEGVLTKLKRRYFNQADRSDAYTQFFSYKNCDECNGSRISSEARSVKVEGVSIPELVFLEMHDFKKFLDGMRGEIAMPLVDKMKLSVQNLIDIGVGYLSLHRQVATLSGGESQRVKMAKQLDCNLINLMYVLDEPSIGLHPKDISQLIRMISELRDKGNTMLVVEHDPEIIRFADYVVDIGPGAGAGGGHITFSGGVKELLESDTITAQYLKEERNELFRRRVSSGHFELRDASIHNLKHLDVKIPAGVFVCVTGVAGSGKSSLIHYEFCKQHPQAIVVDQSGVGRSSRSNPMTYVGIFDQVRKEFARATGMNASLFSFNSRGACPKCKGLGTLKVEMSFLDDVSMLCDECDGKRYVQEVLDLQYKGKSIFDVLQMTVMEALEFFEEPSIIRKLKVIQRVGLDYLELGQALSTLSGGEAQRIKLASELHKKGNIYVMDEPTTGLHMADTDRLLGIINHLVDKGNSVIVIEHNLDVIRHADWVIDLGPEGGSKGGEILAEGTPEDIARIKHSYTGQYLRKVLA